MSIRGFFCLCLALGCLLCGSAVASDALLFDGLIEPSEVVDIGAPSRGVIARILVEKSDEVRAGQLLVELDSSVEKATAARARAQARVAGEIKLQQAKLDFARRAYDRLDDLFANKAISTQKKDEAETEVDIARYRLQKARENQALAELDLKRATALLERRFITSPIDGVVVERFVSVGEFVDDTPLLRIARIDPLKVEVVLPAAMFGRLEKGMAARVHVEFPRKQDYDATIDIVDRLIDSASGTFRVRLVLANPDLRIPSGLKCTVSFAGLDSTTVAGEETKSVFAEDVGGAESSAAPILSEEK